MVWESHQLKYAYTWMALPIEASPFRNWCNPFQNWWECNSILSDANLLPGFEIYFSFHFGTNGVLCCCATMWSYDDCMRVRYLSIGSVPGRKKKSLKNETFLWCILFLWCTDVQNHCYFSLRQQRPLAFWMLMLYRYSITFNNFSLVTWQNQ